MNNNSGALDWPLVFLVVLVPGDWRLLWSGDSWLAVASGGLAPWLHPGSLASPPPTRLYVVAESYIWSRGETQKLDFYPIFLIEELIVHGVFIFDFLTVIDLIITTSSSSSHSYSYQHYHCHHHRHHHCHHCQEEHQFACVSVLSSGIVSKEWEQGIQVEERKQVQEIEPRDAKRKMKAEKSRNNNLTGWPLVSDRLASCLRQSIL